LLAYILYGLFILACLVLVVVILLQPGKADAGALFSSSLSSTAFGPRGTASLLAKITIGAAAAFMLIALTLSLPGITGPRSVLQSTDDDATPAPTQQASPATSDAPVAPGGAASPATESASPGTAPASPAASPQQ
jgi:preprotein translocase subunit SecG